MSQDQNFDLLMMRLNSSFVSATTRVIRERQPEGAGPKLMLDKIFQLKCINYLCKRVSDTLICYGYHLSIDCCRKYITDEKISDCNLDKINYMT